LDHKVHQRQNESTQKESDLLNKLEKLKGSPKKAELVGTDGGVCGPKIKYCS